MAERSGLASAPSASLGDIWLRVQRVPVEPASFVVVAAAYAAHLFLAGYDRFYYDANMYWRLGESFVRDGDFSLLNYTGGAFHGYSMPLIAHLLQVVGSAFGLGAVTIVKLFGALLAAAFGVVVAPRLARELFPGASIGPWRVLALNALIFLFWRDYFGFPLSDFPALLIGSVGVVALLRAGAGTAPYLLAGVCFGIAANMRPAWIPALVVCVAVAGLIPRRPWDPARRGAAVALVLAGALVAFLPEIAINHHQRGSWSLFPPGGKVIAMQQLSDGMIAQKYETYVGSPAGYPQPEVFYFDPATKHVLQEEHISTTTKALGQYVAITSYGQYAQIALRHPFEIAANWLRHVFNGLDVKYPTPYVRDLTDTSIALSLLQYTLMFLAIARLLLPAARSALGRVRWIGVGVLLAPLVIALPTEAESRFFLPLQLFIYMLVCFGPSLRASLLAGSMQQRAAVAVGYIGFVLICLTLSSAALAQREHPGPTLGLGPMQPATSARLVP